MKRWVYKTDLLTIRPAKNGEMVAPGEFAKLGDMIVVSGYAFGGDYLVRARNVTDLVEMEVSEESLITK